MREHNVLLHNGWSPHNPYSLITHTLQAIPRGMGYKGVYCSISWRDVWNHGYQRLPPFAVIWCLSKIKFTDKINHEIITTWNWLHVAQSWHIGTIIHHSTSSKSEIIVITVCGVHYIQTGEWWKTWVTEKNLRARRSWEVRNYDRNPWIEYHLMIPLERRG